MKVSKALFASTSLAIFSMLFGAGNLMFPIKTGLDSGQHHILGAIGFLLTAVTLPIVGIFTLVMFNGDYTAFFNRLGKIPGFLSILLCMLIIGPAVVIPQIINLSYTMFQPFIPSMPLLPFSILFVAFTFLATFKENRLLDVLGYVVSPALLISLSIVLFKGLITPQVATHTDLSSLRVFWDQVQYGYRTLDLFGGIFFASIVLTILKQNVSGASLKRLAMISLKTGTVGSLILGVVNIGLITLGKFHGTGLEHVNEAKLFSVISFNVVGQNAAAIVTMAVVMACFSTISALSVVVAEYTKTTVFKGKINYIPALILTFGISLIPANFGLTNILAWSKPVIFIFYPAVITLTFVNAMYKLWGFKMVKTPFILTLVASFLIYFW